MNFLQEAAIFLSGAIVAVTLFNKIGFGSILGYLMAGIVIGPWGLGLISSVDNILSFSELGVVLLLFLIGLELQPARLWVLRRSIFGLGLLQVLVTTAALSAIAMALGVGVPAAILIGFGLSLSSTAVVLQTLAEKKQMNTAHGRAAFSILLFQDLAVIPALALLPLLVLGGVAGQVGDAGILQKVMMAVLAIIVLVLTGHYLLRPIFRMVAASGSREIFSATSLLLVIGSTLLMDSAGLSMGLGAFIAGILLADSEYRHEIESNIEPFKGLLLGLFFIAVGMSVNIGLIVAQPATVMVLTLSLVLVKFLALYGLARLFHLTDRCARNLAFAMPQGGEFAFVLFTSAVALHVIDVAQSDLLVLIVSLSMVLTPFVFMFNERVVKPRLDKKKPLLFDRVYDVGDPVIIAGFGRVGQIVGRLLRVKKIPFTALEISQTQVDFVRKFGGRVYYGDASRIDLLRAACIDQAKIFVLAIDDVQVSIRVAGTVKTHYPQLAIYARARNRHHAYALMDLGVTIIERESFHSSVELAGHVLRGMGLSEGRVIRSMKKFKMHDQASLLKQHAVYYDESEMVQGIKDAAAELEVLFESDMSDEGTENQEA